MIPCMTCGNDKDRHPILASCRPPTLTPEQSVAVQAKLNQIINESILDTSVGQPVTVVVTARDIERAVRDLRGRDGFVGASYSELVRHAQLQMEGRVDPYAAPLTDRPASIWATDGPIPLSEFDPYGSLMQEYKISMFAGDDALLGPRALAREKYPRVPLPKKQLPRVAVSMDAEPQEPWPVIVTQLEMFDA